MTKISRNAFVWLRSDNPKSAIQKRPRGPKWVGILAIALTFALGEAVVQAQQPKVNRVGIITAGGAWQETIDGLRDGLKQLGLDEGKQFSLTIRETKGDAKAAEVAAKNLEQEKVNLIYTTQTSTHPGHKAGDDRYPHRFRRRGRPGRSRTRGELCKTRRKTHRCLLP